MFAFVVALILFLAAIIGLAGVFIARDEESKLVGGAVFLVAGIIGGIAFFASGYNTVPIRNTGIEQSYGKIVGQPLTPGFHWLAPWDSVIDIPVTTTTDNYNQNTNTPHYTGTCITIRLGQGQEGCADVSVTYAISDNGAQALLSSYGASNIAEQVQNNLVYNNIRQALNDTMGDYDPIKDALQSGTSGTSQFSQFDPAVLADLTKAIGGRVNVISFDLQYVHYSSEVQSQLDGIQQKEGQYQQELEQQQINTATALANQDLVSKTGNLTSQQLQQECLSITQTAEKDNYALPETWGNCITASSGSVIVSK
jgi:regulator of protease activity HflC (stomatin/prohibitin superfamily)